MRIVLLVMLLLTGAVTVQAKERNKLDSLLAKRNFFELRRALQSGAYDSLPTFRKLYFQAFLHNFFYELETSNQEINTLLTQYKKMLGRNETGNLLMKKIDNHVKLYQYKEAHATTQLLLSKYRSILSREEQEDARNSDIIWKGLEKAAPQTTTVVKDTHIPYRRDMAGLINIPVSFADSTYDFIFDTGANLSVINESYARKTGLQMMNVRYKVRAITGIEVMANLGVCNEFKIGDIVVRNAVFIVFPDSSLSFAHGLYAIKGIIGFPVIQQMQEVHINKKAMMVPQTATDRAIRNFGVDELLPVINIAYQTDTLTFTFDTGAQFTFLDQPFYNKYKQLIDTAAKAFDMQIGGAGGITKTRAYRLPQISFNVANQPVVLKDVAVKTMSTTPKDKLYFGNFGQDIMNQFQEMIINFRYMYVDFVP